MRDGASPLGERALAVIACVLSLVAGYVDSLGYLLLAHVYVANMSGNTIDVGRGLAKGSLAEAAARFWPVVVFTFGVFLSELLYELARRRQRRSSASWTLGAEAVVLAIFLAQPFTHSPGKYGYAYYVPVGLLALAMGLQNATLIRVGASSVYTTHITGNLTRLAREGARGLLGLRARGKRGEDERRAMRRVGLMGALWLIYTAGALSGTLATWRWGRQAIALPLAPLAVLVLLDRLRPIGGHSTPQQPSPIF